MKVGRRQRSQREQSNSSARRLIQAESLDIDGSARVCISWSRSVAPPWCGQAG